jgi:hypothetical protein
MVIADGGEAAVADISADDFDHAGGADLLACVASRLALVVRRFISVEECEAHVRGVYAGRDRWIADFDAVQHSLGRAWYTHLEQDRTDDYFEGAGASDALVEALVPGLQGRMLDAVGRLVGGEARRRRGWCGPGVHIFPAGAWLAQNGGDIHYDTEGLPRHHAARRAPALTLVLMLQPPIAGGELKIWAARYHDTDEVSAGDLAAPSALVHYGVGDLLVVDSYRLHQIQPFSGAMDRISATAHALRAGAGPRWDVWF